MQAILIPVKRLGESKLRLSEALSDPDRRRLGLAMLADVLDATQEWERWVVTNDPEAATRARGAGCRLASDPGTGLNDAIQAGTTAASSDGVDSLLVVPADVPLLEASDLHTIFDSGAGVAVVASSDRGTNALLRSPPDVIRPRFGPGSANKHLDDARAAGVRVAVIEAASLLLDIDQPGDLRKLADSGSERLSAKLAMELI